MALLVHVLCSVPNERGEDNEKIWIKDEPGKLGQYTWRD